jgi:ADP-ribose pyrophosphatase YjhB (NUDIX family)
MWFESKIGHVTKLAKGAVFDRINAMQKPIHTKEYIGHAGVTYQFEYYESDTFEHLPQYRIKQCYAIAFHKDKFLVVNNVTKPGSYTPVGGSVEEGENPNDTLIREIQEESNMKVLEYKLLGYQKVTDTSGVEKPYYQLRYFAIVEPYGPFVSDPDGKVTEVIESDKDDYKKYFDWSEIGDRIIEKAYKFNEKKLAQSPCFKPYQSRATETVRVPNYQQSCETDRGLFINVFQRSKTRTSHGLELALKIH